MSEFWVTLGRGRIRRLHHKRSCPTLSQPGTTIRQASPAEESILAPCQRCDPETPARAGPGDRSYQRALEAAAEAADGGAADAE